MKYVYFLLPILITISCKTPKETMVSSEQNTVQKSSADSDCPDGGNCKVEIFKNKKITVLQDGIGATYSQMEDGTNIVVTYTYSKNGPAGTADGNYSETIQFEVPANTKDLNKNDGNLKDVNLIYTKSSFMRGESGLYQISNGKLNLKKSGNTLSFVLDFMIDGTTAKVSHISESVVF